MFMGFPRAALWVGAAFGALLLAAHFYGHPQQDSVDGLASIPAATPPGITLQLRTSAVKARVSAGAQWVYADSHGMTLYTYDQDVSYSSRCNGECAAAWPAALAASNAIHGADWALLNRADGTRQWAYRGLPLYRSAGDKAIGEATGDGAGGGHWHAASFQPGAGLSVPDGIEVREIADAGGIGLVDFSGFTLYSFDGNAAHPRLSCDGGDCARLWAPLEAPEIANPIGPFSAISRDDGITQWAYRGKPLYKYAGDQKPGDIAGADVGSQFHIALVLRFFMPPDAVIRRTVDLGNILATRSGATLYQRDRVTMEELHQFRTDHGSPALGRAFGTSTCDEACAKTWPPFTAPADALPCGYWDIITRPGGARQWAYKGFAMYTYAADKPGETGGNAIYTLAQIGGSGSAAASDRTAPSDLDPNDFVGGAASGLGVSAMFWHAVVP
jgi:predicted lipoprotein with Yx(FWY)xxD motif